jgi:hypothetical protein
MHVMILGLSISTFTVFHVIISIVALLAGLVVLYGLLRGQKFETWTALFLATTVLTSVTGFFFHAANFLPSHVFGILSLVVLAVAILGLYVYHLAGAWRWIYVGGVVLALYLNVFVAVVQAFQKLPTLQPLAPTQSEPPFLLTQLVVLAIFVWLGIAAAKKFRPPIRA